MSERAALRGGARRWERGRLTRYVDTHLRLWELSLAVLSALYLLLAAEADDMPGSVPSAILLLFSALFFAEFALRCWDAPSRRAYLRAHWLDLVSCVPLVGGVRAIRLLRLVRVAAGLRVLSTGRRAADERPGGRQSLWFLGPTLAALWISSAYAIWTLEHGVNPHLHTFFDALYWSFITTTTIGYGDIAPVTPSGRIVAGLLAFVGIGLVGFVSSRLTAMWTQEQKEDQGLAAEMRDLRQEIAVLRTLLERQDGSTHH